MTNLTKAEVQSIIEALDYITLGDAKIELLSAILKLKQIDATPVFHTVTITCTKADQRVPCIRLIRAFLNNDLKEAVDMLDDVTSTKGANGLISFNAGGGIMTLQLTDAQLENARQYQHITDFELAAANVKVDGVPFRF